MPLFLKLSGRDDSMEWALVMLGGLAVFGSEANGSVG